MLEIYYKELDFHPLFYIFLEDVHYGVVIPFKKVNWEMEKFDPLSRLSDYSLVLTSYTWEKRSLDDIPQKALSLFSPVEIAKFRMLENE